jgi:diaphanous 1
MYQLPLDRKTYLLRQNRQFSSVSKVTSQKTPSPTSRASTYSTATGGTVSSRLEPQRTGDSLMKRFPVVGWGSSGTSSTSEKTGYEAQTSFDSSVRIANGKQRRSIDQVVEDLPQLQPQTTGGLWSSWWTSSGGDKGGDKVQKESPKWYVDGIRNGKTTDMKLVKHLISLRVHVSTANIAWIEEFVRREQGIDALGNTLSTLVSKGGKRKILTEVESTVLFELVKCLRVLLNTEVSYYSYLISGMLMFSSLDLIKSYLRLR